MNAENIVDSSQEQTDELREQEMKRLDDLENFRLDGRADDVKIGDYVFLISFDMIPSNDWFAFNFSGVYVTYTRIVAYRNHRGKIVTKKEIQLNHNKWHSVKEIVVDFERVKQFVNESLAEYKRKYELSMKNSVII